MSLMVDNRGALAGKPGLHVLIAGVSDYAHLPADNLQPVSETSRSFGMQKLSCTAVSAYMLYQWLVEPNPDPKRSLYRDLATVRLLLSPTQSEIDAKPELAGLCDPCTLAKFKSEFKAWRIDAASDQDNHTLFYFAGHGIMRSKTDSVLLLEGYDDPDEPVLHHTVDMNHLLELMRPTTPGSPTHAKFHNIARTQTFFVDACRNYPAAITNFQNAQPSPIDDEIDLDVDFRDMSVFYSALSGGRAKEIIGKQTIFSRLLIHSLTNTGMCCIEKRPNGTAAWGSTTDSLNRALKSSFDALKNNAPELVGEQDYDPGKIAPGVIIYRLEKPPLVPFQLTVQPEIASTLFQLQVRNFQGKKVLEKIAPITPYPYQDRLPAGYYRFNAEFEPPHADYVASELNCSLEPPATPLEIIVSP
jgi:hypothetical protein